LQRAKRLITSLQADIKVYKEEIVRLKDENKKKRQTRIQS
jgi:uncharacterized small protein (DUF1192 family)